MSWKDIIKEDWDYDPKYPNINRVIDYKVSNFSNRPMSDIPKLVKQAIIMFGEELEQDIEESFIDGISHQKNHTPRLKKFNNWVEAL